MKLFDILFRIFILSICMVGLLCMVNCNTQTQSELEDQSYADTEGDQESDEIDENEEEEIKNYDISSILSVFDGVHGVYYAIDEDKIIISTTNLPNHKSPYYLDTEWEEERYAEYAGTNTSFRLNPNRIDEQDITFSISLNPKEAATKEPTPMGPIGISRNGVVFFNQYAAGYSALDNEINSFDSYLGHPAGSGLYHYHMEPVYLTTAYGDDAFLGLLADGFPVYGPVENGEVLSSIDLDDYHGHVSATKEFPNGIYHYHISADAPYLNGDGFFGTAGSITR